MDSFDQCVLLIGVEDEYWRHTRVEKFYLSRGAYALFYNVRVILAVFILIQA